MSVWEEWQLSLRFLIVDDTRFMRLMLTDILRRLNHEVAGEADNGERAVAMYRELKPDIVFMDISMPGMDGVKALELILREDPKAKIIICSAVSQQDLIETAMERGAKGYVMKPFKPRQIREVVAQVSGHALEAEPALPPLGRQGTGTSLLRDALGKFGAGWRELRENGESQASPSIVTTDMAELRNRVPTTGTDPFAADPVARPAERSSARAGDKGKTAERATPAGWPVSRIRANSPEREDAAAWKRSAEQAGGRPRTALSTEEWKERTDRGALLPEKRTEPAERAEPAGFKKAAGRADNSGLESRHAPILGEEPAGRTEREDGLSAAGSVQTATPGFAEAGSKEANRADFSPAEPSGHGENPVNAAPEAGAAEAVAEPARRRSESETEDAGQADSAELGEKPNGTPGESAGEAEAGGAVQGAANGAGSAETDAAVEAAAAGDEAETDGNPAQRTANAASDEAGTDAEAKREEKEAAPSTEAAETSGEGNAANRVTAAAESAKEPASEMAEPVKEPAPAKTGSQAIYDGEHDATAAEAGTEPADGSVSEDDAPAAVSDAERSGRADAEDTALAVDAGTETSARADAEDPARTIDEATSVSANAENQTIAVDAGIEPSVRPVSEDAAAAANSGTGTSERLTAVDLASTVNRETENPVPQPAGTPAPAAMPEKKSGSFPSGFERLSGCRWTESEAGGETNFYAWHAPGRSFLEISCEGAQAGRLRISLDALEQLVAWARGEAGPVDAAGRSAS
jgi:CheY-like chemotaxis protein